MEGDRSEIIHHDQLQNSVETDRDSHEEEVKKLDSGMLPHFLVVLLNFSC